MSDLIDLVDALGPLLEPTPANLDTTAGPPFIHTPGVTYLYASGPAAREPSEFDHDLQRFVLSADYVVASSERSTKQHLRSISVALDDRAGAIANTVRANREGPSVGGSQLWHDLRCTVVHNDIRTNRTRGFRVEIRGWRHIGPS